MRNRGFLTISADYKRSTMDLTHMLVADTPVKPSWCGVKQENLFSPALFNLVLDSTLFEIGVLAKDISASSGDRTISVHWWYDAICSQCCRDAKVDWPNNLLLERLGINPKKCHLLHLNGNKKAKFSYNCPFMICTINGTPVPTVDVTDHFTYLGMNFDYKGIWSSLLDSKDWLERFNKSTP